MQGSLDDVEIPIGLFQNRLILARTRVRHTLETVGSIASIDVNMAQKLPVFHSQKNPEH